MTLQQALVLLKANGYTVTLTKGGTHQVTVPNGEVRVLSAAQVIQGAEAMQQGLAFEEAKRLQGLGPVAEDTEGLPVIGGPTSPAGQAKPGVRPDWWPAGIPWPPMTWQRVGTDKDGKPIYDEVFDYDTFARIRQEVRLGKPPVAGQQGKIVRGEDVGGPEGSFFIQAPDGSLRPYFASYTEAQREATKRTNVTATKAVGGVGTPAFTFEAVPLDTGGYTVRVKVAGAETPPGKIIKGEDVGGPEGSFFIRDPDGSLRPYIPEKAAEPTEQYLGTVEEGGWLIDQYGVPDPEGKYTDPDTGVVYRIIARQPRQPIKDPILSLDEMMAQSLAKVDFNDPAWKTSQDYLRAQSLYNFKTQPTSQERLQMALQIAQSPSDYLTLVALYTGAIQRETPARVGERIAPLAPILQMMAQQFFLDIPGINHVPTQEEQAGADGKGEVVPPVVDGDGADGKGEVVPPKAGGDWWDTVSANGRRYDSRTGRWEDWDEFVARTGYQEPEPTIVPPVEEEEEGGLRLFGGDGARIGIGQGEGILTKQGPGFLGGAPSTDGLQTFGPQAMQVVSQGALARQATQQPTKMFSIQEQVQQAQGQALSPKVAKAVGTETVGGLGGSLSMLGSVGKFLEDLAKKDEEKKKAQGVPAFQAGGVVPGYLGQPRMAQVEGGEVVLTPQQIQALLQQSGMFGSVYRPDLQDLPSFLNRPRTTTLSQLTGGALRPRSLQTIRGQSPTQRMLTVEMAKGFGVPAEDFLEEERMATSIGGPRRMARFTGTRVRTGG